MGCVYSVFNSPQLSTSNTFLYLPLKVYEFQIPDTFDASTPAVIFTVEDYPEAYRNAARPEIPTALAGSEPCVIHPPDLAVYLRSKTCPSSLDAFLQANTPLLHVHLAIFNDLTFVGFTSPHIAFDALGTKTLLAAWTRLLSGDALDTIPGMEWDAEPFASFAGSSSDSANVKRNWFDLGLFDKLSFMGRFILRVVPDPKEARYFVRVPKPFLLEAKQKIMDELTAQGSVEYVGTSDVLMAWWLKVVVRACHPS